MIVGLGNPGRTYEDTRHNAGFMVLDRLAARWGAVFKADRQRKCEVAAGPGVLLVKPSTFMNESGLCVGPMMRFFKLDPRSVFVIHDEVDFPLGVIKLREKGSAWKKASRKKNSRIDCTFPGQPLRGMNRSEKNQTAKNSAPWLIFLGCPLIIFSAVRTAASL